MDEVTRILYDDRYGVDCPMHGVRTRILKTACLDRQRLAFEGMGRKAIRRMWNAQSAVEDGQGATEFIMSLNHCRRCAVGEKIKWRS